MKMSSFLKIELQKFVKFHSERCCEVSLKIFMLIIIVFIFRVFILILFGNENCQFSKI